MKSKLFLSFLAIALSAMTAGAINITVDASGNLLNGTGIANKTQYGQGNNNPTSNLNFLKAEISLWNAVKDSDLDSQDLKIVYSHENLSGNSYTILPGYQYVVLHFGGSGGGYWQALYLGGYGGTITTPSGAGGFSSARYVPDGGSTIMLLGAALSVIAVARRKFAP